PSSPNFDRPAWDRNGLARCRVRLAQEGRDQRCGTVSRLEVSFFVQELSSPMSGLLKHLIEFRSCGNSDHAPIKLVGWTKTLGIPGGDFAEHATAVRFSKCFHHQIQMPAHHTHSLFERGFNP